MFRPSRRIVFYFFYFRLNFSDSESSKKNLKESYCYAKITGNIKFFDILPDSIFVHSFNSQKNKELIV